MGMDIDTDVWHGHGHGHGRPAWMWTRMFGMDIDMDVWHRPDIDGQVQLVCVVRLIRLRTDNFRLCNEQSVNGRRKNAWAPVFHLKRQYIYICVYVSVYVCVYVYLSYVYT
jgi:hypothetical protein